MKHSLLATSVSIGHLCLYNSSDFAPIECYGSSVSSSIAQEIFTNLVTFGSSPVLQLFIDEAVLETHICFLYCFWSNRSERHCRCTRKRWLNLFARSKDDSNNHVLTHVLTTSKPLRLCLSSWNSESHSWPIGLYSVDELSFNERSAWRKAVYGVTGHKGPFWERC